MFFHTLDLQKVLDGGPWTFEQSLLVYHEMKKRMNPHLVPMNKVDIWLQIYDILNEKYCRTLMISLAYSLRRIL